jgi:hypothetical protein
MQSVVGRVKAEPAAGFIRIGRTDKNALGIVYGSLGPVRRSAASYTDSERFRDVLGDREQLGNGIKGTATVILIQAGHDDALSHIREPIADNNQLEIEKLGLVNADDLRAAINQLRNLASSADKLRLHLHIAVADDVVIAESAIDGRFENLNALLCDLRPPQSTDELFTLSAEHTSADHFNPAQVVPLTRKLLRHRKGTNYTAV